MKLAGQVFQGHALGFASLSNKAAKSHVVTLLFDGLRGSSYFFIDPSQLRIRNLQPIQVTSVHRADASQVPSLTRHGSCAVAKPATIKDVLLIPTCAMNTYELISAHALSPRSRALAITHVLATALARSAGVDASPLRTSKPASARAPAIKLAFVPRQSVHTNPSSLESF
jgi:hypothetical protein